MSIKGSYRAVFYYIAATLSFTSFFMMFLTPLKIEGVSLPFHEVYFGSGFFNPCIGGFIGFPLLLIASGLFIALGVFESLQINIKTGLKHACELCSIIILFLGIILIFCIKPIFLDANELQDEIKSFTLGVGPMLAGFISLGGAGAASLGLIAPF